MKSLAEYFPPEIAQQIHPDWKKNEADYWTVRDQLLDHYHDQWIAFANGRVLISGVNTGKVMDAALGSELHPFVTCVGRESEPWCRMRRCSFAYDSTYPNEPLPVLTVEFRKQPGVPGLVVNQVTLSRHCLDLAGRGYHMTGVDFHP